MSEHIPSALRLCPVGCGRRFRHLNPESLRDAIGWHLVMCHGAAAKSDPEAGVRRAFRVIEGGRS